MLDERVDGVHEDLEVGAGQGLDRHEVAGDGGAEPEGGLGALADMIHAAESALVELDVPVVVGAQGWEGREGIAAFAEKRHPAGERMSYREGRVVQVCRSGKSARRCFCTFPVGLTGISDTTCHSTGSFWRARRWSSR